MQNWKGYGSRRSLCNTHVFVCRKGEVTKDGNQDVPAEIRTGDLENARQKCSCLCQLFSVKRKKVFV
jgi:hypothetical protein